MATAKTGAVKKTTFLFIFLLPLSLWATIWQVGPSRTYTTPSAVSTLVNDGDTVEMDAAVYLGDVCTWTNNNLLLKGIGGRAHLKANGNNAQGKGTWVLAGNNIRVENIEFSESTVPDRNGAGIRLEGIGLRVTNCYFHHNENGILTGNNGGSIHINQSEFGFNGFGDGFSHNIYIGRVDSAIIRFSYFHHANIGHELKSRAAVNYLLYNRFSNEAGGNASREIDLPSGGMAIVVGNIIQQGANSTNSNMVGYGLEGLVNPAPHEIYLVNNTLVNDRFAGSFLQAATGTTLIKVYNNIFAGPGTVISYGGGAAAIDSLTNKVIADVVQAGFVNTASYDYHLNSAAPAVNSGSNPGTAGNGQNLLPVFQYVHPVSFSNRAAQGSIDIGSYELTSVLPVSFVKIEAFARGEQSILQWQTAEESGIHLYEVMRSTNGINFETAARVAPNNGTANNYEWIDDSNTGSAYYRIKAVDADGQYRLSKIVLLNKKQQAAATTAFFAGENLYLYNLPDNFKNTVLKLQVLDAKGALLVQQSVPAMGSSKRVLHSTQFTRLNGYCIVIVSNHMNRIVMAVLANQ
jgi:hypothetical protein